MCAAVANPGVSLGGSFISDGLDRVFQDSRRVVAISIVVHSCLTVLSLGVSTPFSAAAFSAIVIRGAVGAFISNAIWNVASIFFNFTVKKMYRFSTGNEQIRNIFNSHADQVYYGMSMTIYKIFSAVINGRRFAAVPFNNFSIPALSIMRKNTVILTIVTAIFWVINSRTQRMHQSSGEYLNRLINDHLNNPNVPQQKRNEFRENMTGVSGDFFIQISQFSILDMVSSPNPVYPGFVNEFRNSLEILRRDFQALSLAEKDIIKDKITIDSNRGILSPAARTVFERIRNTAFNSLIQGNENFNAAVQQCLAGRQN